MPRSLRILWKLCKLGIARLLRWLIRNCRKIRLQVQGQLGGIKRGAGHIMKELGVLGLYKGATACLLRYAL